MKISIILPTYKPENYLWECLCSLISQDFPKEEFEILIILNGCNEPYLSHIKEFVATDMKDFHVSIYQVNESGVSNARNMGMQEATGEWITFIDDDDKISPAYLKELYKMASPDGIAICNVKCINESTGIFFDDYLSKSYLKNQGKENVRLFDVRSFMSTSCCKLVPVNVIKNRQFDTKFTNGEDALFMFLISDNIKRYMLADSHAVYYRRVRSGSASRGKTKAFLFKNKVRLFVSICRIYLTAPFRYNFLFFLTRIAATLFKKVN